MFLDLTRKILFLFTFLTSFFISAQEVKFEVESSRNTIGVNERLRLVFKINQEADNFTPPSFADFKIIMGPNKSVSYSITNSKTEHSQSYTYIVEPKKKGTFTIEKATIEVKNKVYETLPITLKITDAVTEPQYDSHTEEPDLFSLFGQRNPFGFRRQQPKEVPKINENDIFIRAEISSAKVYVNESFSVTYKLYFPKNISVQNYNNDYIPSYTDFEKDEFPIKKVKIEECDLNGKNYFCAVLKQVVLYPQRSGNLEVEPLSILLDFAIPTNHFDIFGDRQFIAQQKKLSTQKHIISVKNLPENGKPLNFTGAVGNFNFETIFSKENINSNEAMNVKMNISGNGNFRMFQKPKIQFPEQWEVYEPDVKENIKNSLSGRKGTITSTYTIVPQYGGKYGIDEISFSYFDPKKESYITLKSDSKIIEVLGNKMPQTAQVGIQSTEKQQAQTLQFLKLNPNLKPIGQRIFFNSPLFYLLWILPLSLIIPMVFWGKKISKKSDNQQVNQSKKANRLAKKYFSDAKKFLGDKENFYQSLELGLYNFFKAKLHIENSEFEKQKIIQILINKNITNEEIEIFEKILSNCNMARYSPYTQNDMQNDYQATIDFISGLDRKI